MICECGCGGEIVIKYWHKYSGIPRFIHGHHPQTEETRDKLRERNKGNQYGKGHIVTEEHREKIRIANTGRIFTEKHKRKLSVAKQGNQNAKGHITTEEFKRNQSGENCHFWIEDRIIVEIPYSKDCTQEYRDFIRERDNNICQVCGKTGMERKMDTHHIDYDKRNSKPDNLISLCHSCHAKTSINRDFWKNTFQRNIFLINFGIFPITLQRLSGEIELGKGGYLYGHQL